MKKATSKKTTAAESIARMAEKGKDVSRVFTNDGRMILPLHK